MAQRNIIPGKSKERRGEDAAISFLATLFRCYLIVIPFPFRLNVPAYSQ